MWAGIHDGLAIRGMHAGIGDLEYGEVLYADDNLIMAESDTAAEKMTVVERKAQYYGVRLKRGTKTKN